MDTCQILRSLTAVIGLALLAAAGRAQATPEEAPMTGNAISPSVSVAHAPLDLGYRRPTAKTKLRNYLFDTFGPYPIIGAAILGGINQADSAPPEWGQGAKGYGERVGSNFGIAVVTTSTRYALAAAFREDTIYYRCECKGLFRRINHAVISTVTARVGDDGHRRLSFPALVAPYAGTMAAVYGWYPDRYGVKDGLRMGNYALLAFVGGNIAREFIYGGPHTLFGHGTRAAVVLPGAAGHSNP